MTVYDYLGGKMAERLLLEILDHLADRPLKTASVFRNAVVGDASIVAVNPMLVISKLAETALHTMVADIQDTVREGRMIDFGRVPNAVIKAESTRSREMFEAGELLHPYPEGWLGVTWWEGGCNGYYVRPSSRGPGDVMVAELYGVATSVGDAVMLYDTVHVQVHGIGDTKVTPAPMHMSQGWNGDEKKFVIGRAANSLDPLVTMLRLLADASVPVERVVAPEKLNRARVKAGKSPIPDHSVVHAHDYISQLTAHASRRTAGDGTGRHASPVAHWRRSHQRHLSSGRVVQVRSSKVNWRDHAEIHRLFSRVEGVKG
jgi:hypothetical protein